MKTIRLKKRTLIIFLFLLSFSSCSLLTVRTMRDWSQPKPISRASSIPVRYFVVAFEQDGKPILLDYYGERKYDWAFSMSPALFKKFVKEHFNSVPDNRPLKLKAEYSFYIPENRVSELNSVLTKRISEPTQSVTIKILENNAYKKTQTVYIDFCNDDSNYYSIYDVCKNGLTPTKYGAIGKALMFNAGILGLGCFFIIYAFGYIGIRLLKKHTAIVISL